MDAATAARVVGASATSEGLRAEAERLGVRKLVLTDGDARFPFPLSPPAEKDAALPLLRTLGLEAPLSLRARAP
jgi:hypothetical protein